MSFGLDFLLHIRFKKAEAVAKRNRAIFFLEADAGAQIGSRE